MYHIVIGVDEDESHARLCAEEVLGMPGDPAEKRITLVHSFVDTPKGTGVRDLDPIQAATGLFDEAGVPYDIEEAGGDPAESIIDVADEADADLILVGGRKRSPAGKALFGSVTQTVILHAGRPVMVTGVPDER